jgi:hypothetical protein
MNDPFGYNVFACTIVAAVTLTAGAVTIVHASQRGSPSPAASVNQGLSGSAPENRQFEAVPETAPGASVDTYNCLPEPLPVSRSRMEGEWYGLDSNQSMLITLKIGQEGEPIRLALARRSGNEVATTIYDFKDILVNDGQFSIGGPRSAVQLTGNAEAHRDDLAARGTLTIDGPKGRQRTELYFFRLNDASWLDETLKYARENGLL